MHPSTKYFTFFAYLKKKSKCNKTLIIPVGHFKSGKNTGKKKNTYMSMAFDFIENVLG